MTVCVHVIHRFCEFRLFSVQEINANDKFEGKWHSTARYCRRRRRPIQSRAVQLTNDAWTYGGICDRHTMCCSLVPVTMPNRRN